MHLHSREFRTDADGKFRIDGLLPGIIWYADAHPPDQPYRRLIFEDLSLKSGETKDLGDAKPQTGGAKKKGDE